MSQVFCPVLRAQKDPQNLISGTFNDLTIQEFTEEIEQQTNYYFYYDISLFDSLELTILLIMNRWVPC